MSNAEERADVPVLTQVVDEAPPAPAVDAAMMEALARQLERAVLERLGPEIDRVTRLALNGVRTELSTSVTLMVREAVAASVAQALAAPKRD
jgi:hypothetical protein